MKKMLYKTVMYIIPFLLCFAPGSNAAEGQQSIFISADKLHSFMTGKDQAKPLIFEVSWGGPDKIYNKGHIPGAMHINTDEIEYDDFKPRATTPPTDLGRSTTADQDLAKGLSSSAELPKNWWNLYPDEYLLPAFAYMGISTDTQVVLYDNDGLAAARVAWALLYAGVQKVSLLSGGLNAWEKAGYDVITDPTYRTPVKSFGTDTPLHPEYLVDIAFVRKAIAEGNTGFILGDTRGEKEYSGESAPYPYIPTRGRIKGALWAKAGKTPWDMAEYINKDGTYKAPEEIQRMWAANGIVGDKHVAFYCGTAWRSSLAFLYGRELGWPKVSNFDSSWYEWSMGQEKDRNPVE
ncbi:sulfurtransferase [Desulfopila sp. IMCC35008]|uniref:sulfurtransferase n=1 Tax=Desulfopila sp. IMCC35008 TaxID=2653858 RepID=UPI0013D5BEE6|nr:rhodanese-like domain-containing protein [Desulfopila sp. IMCC35008]